MTYNSQQSGDMVNVDMSPNSSQSQSPYQPSSRYVPNRGDPNHTQNQEFILPDSCQLVFAEPAPPQTLDPSRNGFYKMADFVSDFKDRRAQANFVRLSPLHLTCDDLPCFVSVAELSRPKKIPRRHLSVQNQRSRVNMRIQAMPQLGGTTRERGGTSRKKQSRSPGC